MNEKGQAFLCGFISLAGRPNVGKSTLLNKLIGQEITITANKPQTTRNRIRGILNRDHFQAILVDTPGIHEPNNELHNRIVNFAKEGAQGSDLILFLTEPIFPGKEGIHPGDAIVLEFLKQLNAPVCLVVNKIDKSTPDQVMETLKTYNAAFPFKESVPIAAVDGLNTDRLEKLFEKYLPVGEAYFDKEQLTDTPERTIIAEMVREQIHRRCAQEIPYGVAVAVESFKEEATKITIHATIFVERESHKKIIIGKGGSMIKEIGTYSRIKMEYLLDSKVYLRLHVKIAKDWFNNPAKLNQLGYGIDDQIS